MTTESYVGVDVPVTFEPSWLTWVSATTGCLRFLGADCDLADVAGYSGYAFLINVSANVSSTGPTAFDWGLLSLGPRCLGRMTLAMHGSGPWSVTAETQPDESQHEAALDLVRRELSHGRPCVIWGTYVPEFGIAVGLEERSYRVSSFKRFLRQSEPPIPYNQLNAPGGPYVLAMPTRLKVDPASADAAAIAHAVEIMHLRSAVGQSTGADAYSTWISALADGSASPFGNSYNAQCWSEARRLGAVFLERLAGRHSESAAIARAAEQLQRCARSFETVSDMFPFPGQPDQLTDEACEQATAALSEAAEADLLALDALADAAQVMRVLQE